MLGGCAVCAAFTLGAENSVVWETLGNGLDADGDTQFIQRFTVSSDGPFERLAFCMFERPMMPANPADTIVELLPGYYAVGSPRFADVRAGVPVVVDIVSAGALRNTSFGPDGVHLVAGGQPVGVTFARRPMTQSQAQWMAPNDKRDRMIYGPQAFVINDSLRSTSRLGPYMQIPTPKSVSLTGHDVQKPGVTVVMSANDSRNDYYRAVISNDTLRVWTDSACPEAIVSSIYRRIDRSAGPDGRVPGAVIEDWVDYPYRGLMLDVARNFTGVDDVRSVIDLMARYGLNTLHLHLGDDEGWRLEIPALPELTAVGAHRGYTTTDDVPFLKGIYSGDGNPDATDTPANGYLTVGQYVDLLRYAHSLGIDIIPEFDTPAHSRAAIRAMEHRYRTTGDASLRLIHDGDTSEYSSAQSFHDNIMNPALEGPYRFWDIVFDALIDIYARACVPLRSVHIGGDEVPAHAWDGSDAARGLMAAHDMSDQRQLHAYFTERVARMAAQKGLHISGWQEIALDHSDAYDNSVRPVVASVNYWTNADDKGPRMADKGYPIVLSNVDYLYFDQTPTTHPEEPGLVWGGLVDETRPLHATIDMLCPGDSTVQANVIGISAHLFAETVRSRGMIERYLLPRILGLAERAHNARTTLTDSEYRGAMMSEMPLWAAEGREFNIRQPGIRITDDGLVEMNHAYDYGEIRYTLDGTEPTPDSPLYTTPFDPHDATRINARLYIGPSWSVTSILFL